MTIPLDSWYITGYDPTYSAEIPVREETSDLPIQQESFEVLGAKRKIVIRGFVLGREGSFTAVWNPDETDDALSLLDYLAETQGPHTLQNPFGESFTVDIGAQTRKWLIGGMLEVQMNWVEVA